MANDEHVALVKKGVAVWNKWREENSNIRPDLSGATLGAMDLSGANLSEAYLRKANLIGARFFKANLSGANLSEANLSKANLSGADLSKANLWKANLRRADLRKAMVYAGVNLVAADLRSADLREANLSTANLAYANLSGADLSRASLWQASLVSTDFTRADLTGCNIYGVSAWDLKLDGAKQQNLVITHHKEPEITVDNIEVAQFIYLLLRNEKIRDVIDTITSKAVLILGRFSDERKVVLDALREELRERHYLPILFDFERPRSRDTDETITLLARMARFVIADVTDAKAVLQELRAFVPDLSSLPVQPIILAAQKEPGMFDFYRNMTWFLKVHYYADQKQLLADLSDKVIRPAELKVLELRAST